MEENKQILYLLKNSMSLYKIGISVDPVRRCNEIRLASGLSVKLVKTFTTTNTALVVEQALHRHFRDKRKEGEWFGLTKKDIADIEKTVAQVDLNATNQIINVAKVAQELTTKELFNFFTSFKLGDGFTTKDCEKLWNCQIEFFKALLNVSTEKYWELIHLLKDCGYHVDSGIISIDQKKPFWSGLTFCHFVIERYPSVPSLMLNKISGVYKHESLQMLYTQYLDFCGKNEIEAKPLIGSYAHSKS